MNEEDRGWEEGRGKERGRGRRRERKREGERASKLILATDSALFCTLVVVESVSPRLHLVINRDCKTDIPYC